MTVPSVTFTVTAYMRELVREIEQRYSDGETLERIAIDMSNRHQCLLTADHLMYLIAAVSLRDVPRGKK